MLCGAKRDICIGVVESLCYTAETAQHCKVTQTPIKTFFQSASGRCFRQDIEGLKRRRAQKYGRMLDPGCEKATNGGRAEEPRKGSKILLSIIWCLGLQCKPGPSPLYLNQIYRARLSCANGICCKLRKELLLLSASFMAFHMDLPGYEEERKCLGTLVCIKPHPLISILFSPYSFQELYIYRRKDIPAQVAIILYTSLGRKEQKGLSMTIKLAF